MIPSLSDNSVAASVKHQFPSILDSSMKIAHKHPFCALYSTYSIDDSNRHVWPAVNLLKIATDDIPVQNTGTSQSINYRYHTGTNFRTGIQHYLNVWTNFDMVQQPLAPAWVWWVRTDMVSSLVLYTQWTNTAISGRKLIWYGYLRHQAECDEYALTW